MTLGLIPSWQFNQDPNTNPALTPFVTYPPGVYQTTTQPIGPYFNPGLSGTLKGISSTMSTFYTILSAVGGIAGVYHGYKRTRGSVGWAIGWGIFGGFVAPLAVPLMAAQGFGKPKVGYIGPK